MTALWTAAEAAEATGGHVTQDWVAEGVSIDTRTIQPGDLFVALRAARDGHEFVADALTKGAAAAVVTHVPEGVAEDAPLLIVSDVQAALEDLGRAGRARTDAAVVAVTGSVGKTSTKEMLRAILSDQGPTHASVASYNNHWGVPLTLARMPRDTRYAVIEIGMNHPGEIAPLAKMAQPDVVMITTVAAAHLEAFQSIEEIAQEKAAIMDGLGRGGAAVLNNDCSTAAILQAKAFDTMCRDIGFGEQGFDFKLRDVAIQDDVTVVQALVRDAPLVFKIGAAGRHFAMNGLGALAAAEALGADLALAAQSLGRWSPYQGRGARETIVLDPVDTDLTLQLIDDSYNANPTSLGAALDVLVAARVRHDTGRIRQGRRIAIVGDMLELGPTGPDLHAEIAQHPSAASVDVFHCVGPLSRHLYEALPETQRGLWVERSEDLLPSLAARLDAGDVVLVKGSLSMRLGQVVDAIRRMGHPAAPDDQPT